VSALLTSLSYIPQGRKALPRHSTRDLSLRTLIILTVGLGGWILYGLIIADPIIAIANTAGAGLAAGVVVVLGAWRVLNGSHLTAQLRDFLPFVVHTNGQPSLSFMQWIGGRLSSVAATFVPLWVVFAQSTNPSINAIGGLSPTIIHFYFQYWNSFPFGVGITVFPWVVASLVRFTRRHPWISLQVLLLPAAIVSPPRRWPARGRR